MSTTSGYRDSHYSGWARRFIRPHLLLKLLLAVLSGLPIWYAVDQFEHWWLVEGLALGIFVLAPAVAAAPQILLRMLGAVAFGVAFVFALLFAVLNLGLLSNFGFEGSEVFANPVIFTTILLTSFAPIAGIRLTRAFLGTVLLASLCSGIAFFVFIVELWTLFCFTPCPWWNSLAFLAPWPIWHVAICLALYVGGRVSETDATKDQ